MTSAVDVKNTVRQSYDAIADKYLDWTSNWPSPRERYTDKLLSLIGPSPTVLELGCGFGLPVTKRLVDAGAQVTANDISARQIELAQERCPHGTDFVVGDMTGLNFAENSFDGVAAFFSLFHLPREEQKGMLSKIRTWLKDGKGYLTCSVGTSDEEERRRDFLGAEMVWSNRTVDGWKALVEQVGLKVVEAEVIDATDARDPNDPDYGVKFLWIVAKKV